jgi:hypothetical protein
MRLRFDNEFDTHDLEEMCGKHGIVFEKSPPYHKDYLGVGERINRTVLNSARADLFNAGLPAWVWPDAIMAAVYTGNRITTKGVAEMKTPYEILNGVKPHYNHVKIFGCQVMVSVPNPKHKLMRRSEKCVFVGYEDNAWRCLSLENNYREVVSSKNVWEDLIPPEERKLPATPPPPDEDGGERPTTTTNKHHPTSLNHPSAPRMRGTCRMMKVLIPTTVGRNRTTHNHLSQNLGRNRKWQMKVAVGGATLTHHLRNLNPTSRVATLLKREGRRTKETETVMMTSLHKTTMQSRMDLQRQTAQSNWAGWNRPRIT